MALRILTDFDHAAAERVRVMDGERRVYFAAPLRDSPRGMWFHFRVDGGDGGPVTFVLINREQMLGRGDYRRAVPVFRPQGQDWQRVDPASCMTDEMPEGTGRVSERVSTGWFLFQAPCGPGITEIAYCYPYTMEMLDSAMQRWAKSANAEVITLCRSQHGRPLRIVRIGKPARGRKPVWVLARQHSGEVPGGFAADGLIDAALDRPAWASKLRKNVTLYACPAVDVDGVAEGLYGKDRSPVDFNRDWCVNPVRREIRALREAMDASRQAAGRERLLAVIDLHAPGPGAVSFPVPPHPAWAGRENWQRVWRLAKLIERFAGDDAPIRWANSYPDHIDWSVPSLTCRPASSFHAACELADYSMSLEMSYNWQVNGSLVKPDDWRRMGLAAARAIETIARQVRPLARVRPPEPPFYLSDEWGWLNVPRQCNAKVSEDRVSIQADGPQGYAAVLFRQPIPVARKRFEAFAPLYRTSHGRCPMHRLMFFFKDGVFTGEVYEQTGELSGQDVIHWRGPATRKHPADAAYLAFVVRNWPGTLTVVRPTVQK